MVIGLVSTSIVSIMRKFEADDPMSASTGEGPYGHGQFRNDSSMSLQNGGKRYNHFRHPGAAEDSDEDNDEVLPSASTANFHDQQANSGEGVWRDGQWFNALDEQYLLPVFSNATASRRQATRKAMRSSARLTQHGNESFIDDNEPERDLTTVSRDASRSPWDTSPSADGRQSANNSNSGPAQANGSGAGQARNSRGFVSDHHQPTPSLTAAVSSLFSSMSPVSSSSAWFPSSGTHEADHQPASTGETGSHTSPSTHRTITPMSHSRMLGDDARMTDGSEVQEIVVSDGSLPYTTRSPPSQLASMASFRMPKRRKSDENVQQRDITTSSTGFDRPLTASNFATRTRGTSTSASPLRETTSPRVNQHESLRLTSTPAGLVREEALQRRLSAPIARAASGDNVDGTGRPGRGDII